MEYKNNTSKKIKNSLLASVCAFGMVGINAPILTVIQADTITQEVVTDSEVPSLELRIEDSNGNAINGTFGIYSDSECVTKIQESQSTNGIITLNKTLKAGEAYYIKQLEAEPEYEIDTTVHTFVLNSVSPAEDKLSFSFDGKDYGIGDSDTYRVDGDWGSMKISLKITNEKESANSVTTNDTASSGANSNNSESVKQGTTKSNGGDTSTQTNFNSFGILAGLSTLGIVGVSTVAYKHKKEGGVNE